MTADPEKPAPVRAKTDPLLLQRRITAVVLWETAGVVALQILRATSGLGARHLPHETRGTPVVAWALAASALLIAGFGVAVWRSRRPAAGEYSTSARAFGFLLLAGATLLAVGAVIAEFALLRVASATPGNQRALDDLRFFVFEPALLAAAAALGLAGFICLQNGARPWRRGPRGLAR